MRCPWTSLYYIWRELKPENAGRKPIDLFHMEKSGYKGGVDIIIAGSDWTFLWHQHSLIVTSLYYVSQLF